MNKKSAFWMIWVGYTIGMIIFFYQIGVHDHVDLGKAIVLTIIVLLPAYPIKLWVNSSTELFDD